MVKVTFNNKPAQGKTAPVSPNKKTGGGVSIAFPNGIKKQGFIQTTPYQKALDEAILKASATDRRASSPMFRQQENVVTPDVQSAIMQGLMQDALQQQSAKKYQSPEAMKKAAEEPKKQTLGERVGNTLKGAAKTYGAGLANIAGERQIGANMQQRADMEKEIALWDQDIAAQKSVLSDPSATESERETARTVIETLEARKAAYRQAYNEGGVADQAANKIYKAADKMADSGARNIEKAKSGLGKVGQLAVDAGVAGAQMGADAAASALTGGVALIPMFIRGAGSSAQEARRQGATHEQQVRYGTLSGALSVATEKIGNAATPFKKMFGKGFLDNVIERSVKGLNNSAAGKLVLSFLEEGGEEVLEDLVQPALQTIYNGRTVGGSYSELEAAEVLNDFLVGGILGGLGGGVDAIRNRGYYDSHTEMPKIEGTKPNTTAAQEKTAMPETTAPTAQRPAEQQAQQNTTQEPAPTVGQQNTTPAPAPTVGQQNTMPARPAVTPESAQGTGEGHLTPTQPNAAQGAAEGKADALDAGKRVNLLEYSNERNAQKVEEGLKDGTLAVDAKENIYRVNEDQHIDRRDSASVGERSVNAFQFDHPELHSYYADAAAVLQEEMSFAQKGGELIRRTSREAGDDEYIRTKRGVSERIARLLDDEGVRYDDIDRSLSAIIHNHGQENFAAAKRVELLLDDMLTNGYTDIHGQHIAPNEEYIAAKKAIPGADMSERTHEELPIYDMPEGRNGGIDNAGQETRNDAAGAELADAGERGGVSERGGRRDAGARTGEQSGRLGRGGSQRAAEQSGAAIERQNLARNLRLEPVSSAELGVRAGTDTKSVTVLPESAWDARLQETAQRIQRETGKTPVFVLGSIPVRGSERMMRVRGVWASSQIIVQADHMSVSPEQIASHEIFHEYADQNPGLIQAVERSIREKYGSEEFDGIVESYIRNLRGIIDIDENAADYEVEQALLDVKNEILADAYADINAFGEKAGKYQEDVQQTLEERGIVGTGRETAAATEHRTGPPEKYSYAGRNAESADLDALHEAERYEMQGVDAETIRQKTGWFRGADGKWRWEIDDSGAETDTKWNFLRNPDAKRYNELFEKAYLYDTATAEDLNELQILDKNLKGVRKSPLYLDEIVRHDKLFEAYPALRDVKVRFEANTGNVEGAYHDGSNEIVLRAGLKLEPERLKDTLIHEIQHKIQSTEGFSGGSSPEYWARRDYESGDMIETRLQKEKNGILRTLEKDEVNKYVRYTELERELGKLFLADENSEDGKRYNKLEAEQDAIYEELYPNKWFKSLLDIDRKMENPSEVYTDLYRDTAGEIEARDAASRRGLTAEERRNRKPDTGDENTVFADGGVSYSIANTRDMPWKDQVRGYFSNDGTIKSSDSLYLGESSVEGVDNAPMYIPTSVITKAIRPPKGSRSAHALSQKNILNLQEGIKNAPVVIDNPARNSIVYVTADQDSAGNYIIAALDKSNDLYGETAHKVTSIHGRESIAAMLEKLGDDATIFVKNENKFNRMLPGNQILKSLALRAKVELDDNSVSGHGENVKSPTLGDEIRRQIMGEETEPFKTGESSAKDVDTGGAASSAESVSENGGNVKPKTLGDEIRRQMKEKFSIDDTEEDLLAQQDEADRRKRETREAEDEKLADRALKEDQRRQRQEAKEEEKRQRQQESTYAKAERDAKREDAGNLKPVRKVTKPTEESKPTIAKRDLQKAILDTFSVPAEDRDALRTTIDRYADSVIKNGKLTEKERDAFFDKMYESGIIKTTADETMRSMGQYVAHRKIYVPAEVKALFGQDWNGFRKRAYAADVYLTNDKSAIGVDAFNAELSEQLPTVFNRNETDGKQVLERIVQMAEEGQAERVSLSDYIAEIAGKDSVRGEQLYRELEQKMDNALQTFAEKADLEIKLRDRTNMKLAQQREQFNQRQQEQRAQQKEWESEAKAKKRAENEERERKARERDLIREAKARERRTEAARRRRENRELREMQQKTLKQLQWLSKNRNRAPEALKERWDDVLGDIDIYAISAADELHWSDKYKATWRSLGEMYKRAEKEDPNFLPSEDLKHIVERLDNDKIGDMDIDALTDLYKAAVGLRTEFYNRNNVLNDDMGRMFQEVYTDATRELRSAPKGKKDKSKPGELFDELINDQQLSPMNVLQRMGGWNPNGAFYSMAKQLESGERDVRDYTVKANRLLENFLNEHQDWVKKADGQGKDAVWYELELPELVELRMGDKPIFGETVKVYMTPAQKVHLYLESKNYANLQHMAGGRTFVDKELYSKGKRAEALAGGKTVKLAPETVKKIVSDLTPEEAELAKILRNYYNDFAPKAINKVSNTLLGYDKAITKDYAPIFSNQNYTKSEFGKFDVTAEGVGHLKPREYSKNPSYNISAFDAFERHVDQTARYTGMAIPTRNMNTLMNWGGIDSSMRDTIAHEWGDAANEYITDLVTDMQGGKAEKKAWTDKLTDKAFSNYISAVFGFNPSIVLKQLGSIPMGSAYLGAKNFPSVKQIRSIDTDLISKYTQELQWRTMGYSMPETKQLKDNPNWTETNRFTNFAFGGGAITAMDGWAASVLWPQAENKVRREHPNLEVGTKEQIDTGESPFYQEVAREFNDAVARSQSTSDIIHQGTLRRSKSAIARAFTLFKSDSSQTYNAIRQKYGELQFYKNSGANEETVKKAKKSLGEAVTAAIVNAVWSQTVTFMIAALKNGAKRYRDDDDELTIESVLKKYGTGLVGDLAGVMAGGEELADIFGNMLSGDQWYRIETPGLEQLDDLIEGIIKRGGSLKKHGDEMIDILKNGGDLGEYMRREGNDLVGWLKDVAKDIATYGYGIPANNVEAYLLGIVRSISPEAAAAYEDAAARVEKSNLSHTHGRTLKAKTRDLLKDRTGSGKRATADAVASLYDDGYTGALPSATPNSVTIDGETHKLSAYQTQVYEKAWRKAVGGALDEMVTLNAFRNASKETREKMLKNLYAYAGDVAKAAAFSEYEPKKSTQQISESAKHGLTVAVQIVSELADEDAPKGLSLPTLDD